MPHAVPTWVVSFDEVSQRRHTQHKIPCIGSEQLSGDTGMAFFFVLFLGAGVGGGCTQNLWAAVPTFLIFFLLFTFTFFMGRLYGDTTWRDDGRIG